jgi:hypothetical protein
VRASFSALLALIWLGGGAWASEEEDFWHEMDAKLAAQGPKDLAEETESLQLGEGVLAVAASDPRFGYLAILDHGNLRWTAHADPASPDCWRGAFERPCSATKIAALPGEADGISRFYVVADYFQEAGATRGHQLSLWRWKSGKAQAFYTTDFITGGDAPQGVTLRGDEIEITGKGFWRNFSVCGACDGRQQTRRLRVSSAGVQDLGTASLFPGLDAVDALLGGNQEVATPDVAARLKKSWHGTIFIVDPPRFGDHSACLAPEDLPALTFRFNADSTRIVSIEPGACR